MKHDHKASGRQLSENLTQNYYDYEKELGFHFFGSRDDLEHKDRQSRN